MIRVIVVYAAMFQGNYGNNMVFQWYPYVLCISLFMSNIVMYMSTNDTGSSKRFEK